MILLFGSFWPPSTGNLSSNSIWNTRVFLWARTSFTCAHTNTLNPKKHEQGWGGIFLSYKSAVLLRNFANKACQWLWTSWAYGMVFPLLHMLLAVQNTTDIVEHFWSLHLKGRESCGSIYLSLAHSFLFTVSDLSDKHILPETSSFWILVFHCFIVLSAHMAADHTDREVHSQ